MEIDKITLEREFLDKLLSLNYLNESDWAELEIARLLHILPRSFRMRRCRLKRKMGVDCDSLPEFIKKLFR